MTFLILFLVLFGCDKEQKSFQILQKPELEGPLETKEEAQEKEYQKLIDEMREFKKELEEKLEKEEEKAKSQQELEMKLTHEALRRMCGNNPNITEDIKIFSAQTLVKICRKNTFEAERTLGAEAIVIIGVINGIGRRMGLPCVSLYGGHGDTVYCLFRSSDKISDLMTIGTLILVYGKMQESRSSIYTTVTVEGIDLEFCAQR